MLLEAPSPIVSILLCRARGLLAWSQQDLAKEAGVGIVTVHQLEAGTSQPRRATLEVIKRAFEAAGVEFIDRNYKLKPGDEISIMPPVQGG